MPDWLIYWCVYWQETKDARSQDERYLGSWETDSSYLYERAQPGTRLWIVVVAGPHGDSEWRLLERGLVKKKRYTGRNPWRYAFVLAPDNRARFDLSDQKDFAPLLRRLTFASGKSIRAFGRKIGQSRQTPRLLALSDVKVLETYAESLAGPPSSQGPRARRTANPVRVDLGIHERRGSR